MGKRTSCHWFRIQQGTQDPLGPSFLKALSAGRTEQDCEESDRLSLLGSELPESRGKYQPAPDLEGLGQVLTLEWRCPIELSVA